MGAPLHRPLDLSQHCLLVLHGYSSSKVGGLPVRNGYAKPGSHRQAIAAADFQSAEAADFATGACCRFHPWLSPFCSLPRNGRSEVGVRNSDTPKETRRGGLLPLGSVARRPIETTGGFPQ